MPTARELIEQADALMRRNRAHAKPAGEALHVSRIQPAAPVEDDAFAPVRDALAPDSITAPTGAQGEEIPLLTESVAAVGDDAASADALDDDVPVLTDAIEEIEAPPVADELVEGDQSDWLLDTSGDVSVLGPVPPSVMVVPPAREVAATAQAWAAMPLSDARGEPANGGNGAAPAAFFAPELPPYTEFPDEIDIALGLAPPSDASRAPEPEGQFAAESHTDFAPVPDAEYASESEAEGTFEPEREIARGSQAEVAPAPEAGPETDFPLEPESAPEPVAELAPAPPPEAAQGFLAEPSHEPESIAEPAAPPVEPLPPVRDDVQWHALAEEVRMQVLQRIDIFTDTGLREKLGERLKPVVDRASADLVATINQHVGDLMRAYVAEAIEREIERWRNENT